MARASQARVNQAGFMKKAATEVAAVIHVVEIRGFEPLTS